MIKAHEFIETSAGAKVQGRLEGGGMGEGKCKATLRK
jgi:hypothetical protein